MDYVRISCGEFGDWDPKPILQDCERLEGMIDFNL